MTHPPFRDDGRILVLDPLRALASCAVMWAHFTNASTFLSGPRRGEVLLRTTGIYGGLGVYIFFVISGFVLPYALWRGAYTLPDYGRFVCKRLLRLEPPYLAALLLTLVLLTAAAWVPGYRGEPFRVEWTRLALHLGYLNAFTHYEWYNRSFWTLAIEFQFYLAVGLLFPLLVHRRLAVRTAVPLLLGALAFTSSAESLLLHYLAVFALGIATAQHHVGLLPRRVFAAVAAVLCVALYATLGRNPALAGAATAALIVALGRVNPAARAGRLLAARPLVWLGALSYSIYLLHIPVGIKVLSIGDRFADRLPALLLVLAAGIAATLAASDVLYRLVERPSQRWSSRVRYRAQATRPPARPVAHEEEAVSAVAQ